VLAVDLGTSGPKAAVVSVAGRLLATARAQVQTLFLPDGGAEQDPEAVWRAVKTACADALKKSAVAAKDVRAVICSSQYSSIVPVDRDARPTMNMLLWLDKRGTPARLRALPAYPKGTDTPLQILYWLRAHGLAPLAGGMSLNHMRFIKYARPDVYERTATFLEPMDYLALRFSGRATANQCTASMLLLTDNRRLGVTRYDPRLLQYARIDAGKLPELVPLDAVVGTLRPDVAAELGLSPATKVVTGLNDTQSGGIGTYAFSGAHAAISVGSTAVMISHVDRKRTDVRHMIFGVPSPVPGTYFVMAENGVAGAALEHFLANVVYAGDHFGTLTAENRYAALERAVGETRPGSGGVLFLPWLAGSMAPAVDAHMGGGFLNLGLDTTRSQMARAVLEGVAMNLRWLRDPVEKFAGRRFSHFLFYGGGAESAAWSQIMADVLGAPVHQLENPRYATCVGAALLAFERLALIGFDDFQRLVPIRRVYEPQQQNQGVYQTMFAQFGRAFRRTRPLFRALNASQEIEPWTSRN
jgi:xylulokinase